MGNGKKKIKKFVKNLFGKDFHVMNHSEYGPGTEFTVGKKKTKVKGPKGKEIYTDKDKKVVDFALSQMSAKKGGVVNRFKKGGIIQHD
jgi:hypothetical protein|tara:strand:+ start:1115 stop:1378 length:264 start_codon:yes stop_codon:yes gene_type:complete